MTNDANDVEYRLAQALEIAQVVTDDAAAGLAKRLDLSGYDSDALLLLCYNPNPYPTREILKVNVMTPAANAVWSFTASDTDGTPLDVQEIARDEKAYPVHDTQARPWPYKTYRHLCYLDSGTLPALGYKVLTLTPAQKFEAERFYWLPMRRVQPNNILAGTNILENEHLRAEFHPNGSLCLMHKATGHQYDNLHYLEDSGDVGNYWAYHPPYHNQIHTSLGNSARIWAEDNGPLSATIAVEYTMKLPATAEEPAYGVRGHSKRSEATKELLAVSRFTLTRDSHRLEVHTTVWNTLENHRLRIAFPTGIQTDFSDAAGHFTVDRRPKVNQPAADGSYWPEMQTLPMQTFVDINDGTRGLALLHDCLTEYELANDQSATLYLTLFRAMGNMIVTWWEAVGRFSDQDGSQLQRKMEYHYALYPHEGDWQSGNVFREAQVVNAKPAAWQLLGGGAGDLPLSASFCHITNPQVILSAVKQSEDKNSLILRIYNPTAERQTTKVTFGFAIRSAWLCNLNENHEEQLPVADCGKSITLDVPAGKIITTELR